MEVKMSRIEGKKGRLGWLAGVAALLSLVICYGTLGLIAILSLMGISLAINVHLWAGTIVAFALVVVLGVALGYHRHCEVGPLAIAGVGALLVILAMYGSQFIQETLGMNERAFELVGFAGLLGAAIWDWRLKAAGEIE